MKKMKASLKPIAMLIIRISMAIGFSLIHKDSYNAS